MRKLWFEQTIKEAVDEARIHHQIFPMTVQYEFGITEVSKTYSFLYLICVGVCTP